MADIGKGAEAHFHERREAESDEVTLRSSSDLHTSGISKDSEDSALIERARGDINNPIPATFNVFNWKDIAEENCYVILCDYGGRLKWSASHFPTDDARQEFPWASLMEGGANGHLLPATLAQQRSQSSSISAGYNNAQVGWSQYMTLNFVNYDTTKVYCPALFKQPPDTSVCKQRKKASIFDESIDPSEYDYQKIQGTNPIKFQAKNS
ncbi:hypothetical protein F4778DRAFT_796729 [Xylariomycetidae sp. FL2044]|nr:hypothetical protein F4778DRAFT_796729 [Xylariomycetidae sp. FL2044]